MLRERGAADEALSVLAAGFQAGGDTASWHLERGLAYVAKDDLTRALPEFLAVVAAEPDNRAGLENASQAAYHLGRLADAVALYRRVADLDPSQPGPWKTLGAVQLYGLGDGAAARESFQRALAVETDPADRAELAALLAEIGGS
jgi:tetratricopeptide (TPR) repeat protein